MKVNYTVLGAVCLACIFMATGSAFAYNARVMIVNGTSNHCTPYLSCYKPYQVDISPGDTVTWINEDNRTHTATTGTTNYGPQAVFDSGLILPGHSYTQFFGTVGKYTYYDQVDMWPSGIVVVTKNTQTHAELSWVNGSLLLNPPNAQDVIISKQIQNTGSTDANSIVFRLRIYNETGFLFFDNITRADVPAKQATPVNFKWAPPSPGVYNLNFDADAANVIGDTNENNDVSSDIIQISSDAANQDHYLVMDNSVPPKVQQSTVPEFGTVAYMVLASSLVSILLLANSRLRFRI